MVNRDLGIRLRNGDNYMFIFKKILTPFLLPPGIFIGALILSGVWFLLRKNWGAGIINCLIGSLMWSLSISPISHTLLRGLESDLEIPKSPKAEVIILIGGGVYEKAPDLSDIGTPTEDMLARIVTVVRLQKKFGVPVIISAGGSEAPIVKRFLVDLGVPPNKIITEEKSGDTYESAKFTQRILERFQYDNLLLVTSAYHIKRAVMSFEKAGVEVIPIPACFNTWPDRQYGWIDYLPGSFDSSIAIREYLGLVFYKYVY